MKTLALGILAIFMMSSCTREADIELPKTDPKMAVSCFITPGAPVEVVITKVVPLYNAPPVSSIEYVHDAVVGFSDGNDTAYLVYGANNRFRDPLNTFQIRQGQTYYLFASSPSLPSIRSFCTVPDSAVSDYTVSYQAGLEGPDSVFNMSMQWQDLPGASNYYRVQAERIDTMELGFVSANSFGFNTSYYNDFGREGEQIQTGLGSVYSTSDKAKHRWIISFLLTCDVNYFRYHLSLESFTEINPFSEPTSLYSNIEGGLGCFGAYVQYTDKLKVF